MSTGSLSMNQVVASPAGGRAVSAVAAKRIVTIDALIVFGHNLLDSITVEPGQPGAALWAVLHDRSYIALPWDARARTSYPLLPWIGVIALGHAIGPWFAPSTDAAKRRRRLWLLGGAALTLFVVLHLGLPVDYLGVNIKREFANGLSEGTRLWHADPEDERMLKLIVYLSDVDAGSGPFAAIDARRSAEAKKRLHYAWGSTCTPEALEKVVPAAEWRTFTGPRLTAVLCDTARCLHRASPPTTGDRYSMTFSYLSREAWFCFASGRTLQRAFVERWGHQLDAHQRSCLMPP